jgi:hypothetical membrane protein
METQGINTQAIKLLLTAGPVGSLFFILSFTVQGLYRTGYDPSLHPVSSLSLGPMGWMQIYSFVITGLLIIGFSFGVKRSFLARRYSRRISHFILAAGIGLTGAGVFSTDPVYGYPPQLPLRLAQFTWQGHLHDFFSLMVFVGIPAAALTSWKYFVITGQKGISIFSLFAALTVLLAFILAGAGFKQAPVFVDFAGLLQRASIIGGCTWLTVLGIYLIKENKVKTHSL